MDEENVDITEDELSVISDLELDSITRVVGTNEIKTYEDYKQEEANYLKVLDIIKKFSTSDTCECYRCELFERGDIGKFLTRSEFSKLAVLYWERCGRPRNSEALEAFIGRHICIRCAASILLSHHPVIAMRADMRLREIYMDNGNKPASSSGTLFSAKGKGPRI